MEYVAAAAVVVVVALLAAALVAKKRYGGVKHALSKDLAGDRRALDAARKDVKACTKARDAELKPQLKDLAAAEKAYESRLSKARTEAHRLWEPGRGDHLGTLGGVAVWEHRIKVSGTEVALAGTQVQVRSAPTSSSIYLVLPSGQSLMCPFNTEYRQTGVKQQGGNTYIESKRDFSDEQVRAFANGIHNAIVQENAFVVALPELRREADLELELAKADTSAVDVAREALERARAQSPAQAALSDAENRLRDVEEGWLAKTAA